jgi:type III secretion protein V
VSRFDPTVITWILQDLLEDFVSVRDLRNILEALASVEGLRSSAHAMGNSMTMADVEYWSNWIRSELTRQITQPLTVGSTLIVHQLAPDLEARVAASDHTPLSDSDRQQLVQLILAARRAQASGPMIVLTSLDVKRRLRRLIVDELPEVRVIAYQELDPFTSIVPRARIGGDAPR